MISIHTYSCKFQSRYSADVLSTGNAHYSPKEAIFLQHSIISFDLLFWFSSSFHPFARQPASPLAGTRSHFCLMAVLIDSPHPPLPSLFLNLNLLTQANNLFSVPVPTPIPTPISYTHFLLLSLQLFHHVHPSLQLDALSHCSSITHIPPPNTQIGCLLAAPSPTYHPLIPRLAVCWQLHHPHTTP